MRAWIYSGPGRMTIEERPVPTPGPGEVRVRVAWAGICGSDVHGYTGASRLRTPGNVMGHEGSGVVDALGSNVTGLQVGAAVTFLPTVPCSGMCGHTMENQCARLRIVGCSDGLPGAFADYLVVPADRIVPLGPVPLRTGAFIEPLAVGLHAVHRAGAVKGNVLVMGGGAIGLAAAMAARLEGAARVIICEPRVERRRVAEGAGLEAIDPDEIAAAGPFDCGIDAVAIPNTLETGLGAIRPGANLCVVGLGSLQLTIDVHRLVFGERAIVGSDCYTDAEFHSVLRHVATASLNPTFMLIREIAFEELGGAMRDLASHTEPAMKILVRVGP